ncbi:hypothetical protein CC80DRAFT_220112 [Byssothecium circinans]|uniref:Uncharacterized protein n=1 Tax=Byssothecium circinans TaxID=147558 RepID=A0A6A5TF32_9PLEO|nr:hypothetical protein CC80DRAFT_220112 [Byssothecium circinans]
MRSSELPRRGKGFVHSPKYSSKTLVLTTAALLVFLFLHALHCVFFLFCVCEFSIKSPVYLSICLSVYLSICLSVYLSICLSVYLSACSPAVQHSHCACMTPMRSCAYSDG